MTYRAIFFNILISVTCCVYSPTMVAGQNKVGMPQMQDFEKELEEANKAIEEYVTGLPPEEQAEFNRQVEGMSRMFENMSEEEFEKFLGEMFTEEQMMEPNPFEITQPVTQEVVEVALSAEDKKKVETAIKILDDIINQSNLFTVIINSSPELPNRITRWGTKGALSNWQTGSDWNAFKLELEALIQKLYKAEEQNIQTKQYKYLLELIADEALYNNLIQLQTSLNSLVPIINLPEFSIQKLSAQSKTAIKDILQKYTESFYLLTIPKSLDALFEKYAPEAEKIRAAEEAANKQALEASKITRTPASPTEAGADASMGYDYGYGSNYYGGDYGYNPYDSRGSYGGDYGYSPDYSSYGSDTGSGTDSKSGGSGSNGRPSGAGGRTREEEKIEDKDKDKDKDKGDKIRFIPDHEAERAIADIKRGLNDIKDAMVEIINEKEKPTKLATLDEHIKKENEPVDVILAGSTLPKIVDKTIDIINKALKTIDKKIFSSHDLAHYQHEIQKAFDTNKNALEQLSQKINTFGTDEEIKAEEKEATKSKVKKDEEPKAKTNIKDLSPEHQWAYFGGEESKLPENEDTKKLKDQIGTPVSLFDIRDKINNLFDDIKKFSKKTSDISVITKKQETSTTK